MQGVKRALDYGYSLWEMGIYEAVTVQAPQFSLSSGTYKEHRMYQFQVTQRVLKSDTQQMVLHQTRIQNYMFQQLK